MAKQTIEKDTPKRSLEEAFANVVADAVVAIAGANKDNVTGAKELGKFTAEFYKTLLAEGLDEKQATALTSALFIVNR